VLADLHNHSCLSPCASLEMSPRRIAEAAARSGIGLVALTDHNSARNTPAFEIACRRAGVAPLFGLEITTAEECHVLALFDSTEAAMRMDAWVTAALPRIPLDSEWFGDQPVVDDNDNIVELLDVLLISAIDQPLEVVGAMTHQLGGLFIPSHINRQAFSIESQLGFLPPGDYDAIEVLPGSVASYRKRYPHLPVITASDAHSPDQLGTAPFRFHPADTTIPAIRKGLQALCVSPRPCAGGEGS